MTDTNWPNPERPGYPMFPERDGLHAFTMADYPGYVVFQWISKNDEYRATSYDGEILYSPNEISQEYEYHGPVLTPTQINEMLAAERERICLMIERSLDASCSLLPTAGKTLLKAATEDITDAIRNLGAAP